MKLETPKAGLPLLCAHRSHLRADPGQSQRCCTGTGFNGQGKTGCASSFYTASAEEILENSYHYEITLHSTPCYLVHLECKAWEQSQRYNRITCSSEGKSIRSFRASSWRHQFRRAKLASHWLGSAALMWLSPSLTRQTELGCREGDF